MRFGAMLDLGCGTGLGGAAFRAFVDRLVGVDLSPAMVAQASAKGLYDRSSPPKHRAVPGRRNKSRRKYDLVSPPTSLFTSTIWRRLLLPRSRTRAARLAGLHGRDPCRRRREAFADTALCPWRDLYTHVLGSRARRCSSPSRPCETEKGVPVDSL
jgi:hypothetical protein